MSAEHRPSAPAGFDQPPRQRGRDVVLDERVLAFGHAIPLLASVRSVVLVDADPDLAAEVLCLVVVGCGDLDDRIVTVVVLQLQCP